MAGTMLRITTPDLRSMSQPAAIDPDISATLSDFLTYTEHLPSSVIRSLTLIETLNGKANSLQQKIHELLKTYARLPNATVDAPDPVQLRKEISHAYDKLEECKRMSAAESVRIEDMVAREARKLSIVTKKLKALPMPPSRDPTPEPVLVSPRLKKSNQAQQHADKRTAAHRTSTAPRVRGRKIMVPGEVLPPPNPDSPPPSEPSDWASPPPASPDEQRPRHKSVGRQRTPKSLKVPREKIPKPPRVRLPGARGTNAHSAVAGISTSNALNALKPPPDDAPPGSRWKPWKKLTEFELATIRKRMKKNAKWIPSPAMKNRELKELGRGQTAMDKAREDAEAGGPPFIDEYDPATWVDPTQGTASAEEQAEANAILGPEQEHVSEDQALINRGMRLNEAKRIKREKLKAEEQALNQQLQDVPAVPPATSSQELLKPSVPAEAASSDRDRKRKRDATPVASIIAAEPSNDSADIPSRPAAPLPKKIKLSSPAPALDTAAPKLPNGTRLSETTQTSTTGNSKSPVHALTQRRPTQGKPTAGSRVPLASTAPAPTKAGTPATVSRPRSRRTSVAPDLPPPVQSRPPRTGPTIKLKGPKAASAEPPHRRAGLRRGSNASLPGGVTKLPSPAPKPDTVSRAGRRRRPVPGLVTTEEGEGAKPTAKGALAKKDDVPAVEEELIDPDEPRYCVCGDVSWGTMIACDNDDCEKEWFHLDCVKLEEMPPRRTKWYCPDCRKKLKLGLTSNGIVR
ncbi:hypothetical protein MBLNU459_g3639t1 [Dothideomycetes sp. NU459]